MLTDIIEFVESTWGLSFRLYPVQRVFLKVAHGIPLDDTVKFTLRDANGTESQITEAGYLRFLYDQGRCNIEEVTSGQRHPEVVVSMGRRAGKDCLLAAMALYEMQEMLQKDHLHEYYGLPPASFINIGILGVSKDLLRYSQESFWGFLRGCSFFTPYVRHQTQSYSSFQSRSDVQAGSAPLLRIMFRTSSPNVLRGLGFKTVFLDEVDFYPHPEDTYQCVTPGCSCYSPKDPADKHVPIGPSEGRIILMSSLAPRRSFLAKRMDSGMHHPEHMLVFRAPTWEVNPSIPQSEYDRFRDRMGNELFLLDYGVRLPEERQ